MEAGTVLCIGIITLVSILFLKYKSKRRNLPPGPVGWPILGFYPFLGKDPVKTISRLGQKYGNVFSFYIGSQYVTILNDWKAMIDVFSKEPGLYKPPELFAGVPYNFGVGGANGAEWGLARRLLSKAMKDIGMHRTKWEELVQEEVAEVIKLILQHGPNPLDVNTFFAHPFSNNILTLVLGERLEAGHPLSKDTSRVVDLIMESSATLNMGNYSPRLKKMLEVLGFEKELRIEEEIRDYTSFVSKTIDEQIKNSSYSEDSFIHLHHKDLENILSLDTESKEKFLKGDVLTLIVGGSETTRTTTIWALIAMAEHPEVQRKVQEELDKELCGDAIIRWSDRQKIPYTHAAILESMRWRTVVPLPGLRKAAEDMEVQGYLIPKGTFMIFNEWATHNDPKYWEEPQKYLPERFLTDGGTKVNSSLDSFAPFSYGKRNCPGKLIAMMELLQYFTAILKKFKVMPSSGNKVKYEERLGLSLQPVKANLCFIPRE